MNHRIPLGAFGAAIAVSLAFGALAQTQQVKPPVAVYWMSVETAGGMGFDIPPGMGALMPQGMAGGKRIKLDLGSSQVAGGEPRAAHTIPAGLAMGQSLPLVTPRGERAGRERDDEEREPDRPRGRVLIYWGCGEQVRAGQPVILDFAKMNAQEAGRAFRNINVARARGPSSGRNRSFGDWPNAEDSRAVPGNASLQGDHVVAGNYSPEIRFAVGERHDFMEAVAFDAVARTAAGAYAVNWKAVPTATGYFASAAGQGESQNDVVMWASSEIQTMGQTLMDFIAPAEVDRLIREKVVMSPQVTECKVPAGIFKGEGAMLNFIAYGDELNLVQPPRPGDPKQTWEQIWAVKVRLKSTAMTMLSEDDGGRRGRSGATQRGTENAPPAADRAPASAPTPADAVQEGVRSLRRLLPF